MPASSTCPKRIPTLAGVEAAAEVRAAVSAADSRRRRSQAVARRPFPPIPALAQAEVDRVRRAPLKPAALPRAEEPARAAVAAYLSRPTHGRLADTSTT